MGDVLKYRLPNKDSQSYHGWFVSLDSFADYSGFVISTFDKSKRFGFVEDNVETEYFSSEEKPICYSQQEYLLKGEHIVEELKSGETKKAILSRVQKVDFDSAPNELYDSLCDNYPDAFVYLISSELFGTWIAATPEVLIKKEDSVASTMALAGTRKVDSDVEWTDKERDEQLLVSDFVHQTLISEGANNIKTEGPNIVNVGPVKHIRTDFTFKIDREKHIDLIEKLHPTPAVCGTPKEKALKLIKEVESHDRSLYAGIIGELGEELNLFVNLRCAQLIENECYLYLGGGYTEKSIPNDEWIETENKAKTLLNIIEKL